jgi:UDP-N-acetylglucosamine diphosphorylase/glucosamine-1-phosphate N-acetyltransferase
MQCIIFSAEYCQPENLYPFHLTRHIQDIRLGILTIREKWEKALSLPSFDKWEGDYKESDRSKLIDASLPSGDYLLLHANILPTQELVSAIQRLAVGQALIHSEAGAIALHFNAEHVTGLHRIKVTDTIPYEEELLSIKYPWDIFRMNERAIREDFQLVTKGRSSCPLPSTNQVIGEYPVFLEGGAELEGCIINVKEGPVYIGNNAVVMEGTCIRGPVAIGAHAQVKMGTKIYGGTTIGPFCIAGGEIKNAVMMGYSNKAHEGYLGDAVIGEWCNLGAGTSASNVKNSAGPILVYHPASEGGKAVVGNKCGLIMGDYSRAAINTSFNTGTVVGVCSSVFGTGLLPKYIPHFSWGAEGIRKYEFSRAIRDLENWKKWKYSSISPREENILRYIYDNF